MEGISLQLLMDSFLMSPPAPWASMLCDSEDSKYLRSIGSQSMRIETSVSLMTTVLRMQRDSRRGAQRAAVHIFCKVEDVIASFETDDMPVSKHVSNGECAATCDDAASAKWWRCCLIAQAQEVTHDGVSCFDADFKGEG
jgi:hypothetical protein